MAWNGSDTTPKVSSDKRLEKRGSVPRPALRYALVGGVVVVFGSLAVWLLLGRNGARPSPAQRDKPRAQSAIAEVTPAQGLRKPEASDGALVPAPTETNDTARAKKPNTNGVHYASLDSIMVVGADGVARSARTKPIFKERVDNMLWAAIRPGGMPSGLNALRNRMRAQTGSDAAFLEVLRKTDITIEPDDPPHVVTAKEQTIATKKEIIAAMDAGTSFDEIYREISTMTRDERAYRSIVREDVSKITRAGDAAALRKYAEDVNPVLREKGLPEVRVPSWAQEAPEGATAGSEATEQK